MKRSSAVIYCLAVNHLLLSLLSFIAADEPPVNDSLSLISLSTA
jgi:hypothetical protein